MTTACIIQARMNSSRLYGKVMLTMAGKTVLGHCLSRAKRIPGVDVVICAVPDLPSSGAIETEAMRYDAKIVRGPEQDVLARYYKAALSVAATTIVRVTSDCPKIDPDVCGRVLALLKEKGCDYASNVHPERTWPKGLDCEAFTWQALHDANHKATEAPDREHVGPWMQRHLKTECLKDKQKSAENFSIDTPEDYERVCAIFERRA